LKVHTSALDGEDALRVVERHELQKRFVALFLMSGVPM